MTTESTTASTAREPELAGQTVVLIGGSAGIGLETARRARADGADVILAARDPERLKRAADDVGARSTAALDATDQTALKGFFGGLPGPIDHVLVTPGPGYVLYAARARIPAIQLAPGHFGAVGIRGSSGPTSSYMRAAPSLPL